MAAASLVSGQNDRFLFLVKSLDQLADKPSTSQRMIDGAQNHTLRAESFQPANSCPYGGKLALFPIRIQYHVSRIEFRRISNGFRSGAQNDARDADTRMARHGNQMFKESAFAVGQQGFRSSHPAGSAGGEDNGG